MTTTAILNDDYDNVNHYAFFKGLNGNDEDTEDDDVDGGPWGQ